MIKNLHAPWLQPRVLDIEYYWPEDEHEVTLLSKSVENEEFERDLVEAKKFATSLKGKNIKEGDYLGRRYSLECLPEFYEQIIWFLTNRKGYTKCSINEEIKYRVDNFDDKEIRLTKFEDITHTSELA